MKEILTYLLFGFGAVIVVAGISAYFGYNLTENIVKILRPMVTEVCRPVLQNITLIG
jgi:hypothetical protein